MKYRYLTFQELDLLHDDFSDFLYTEGINRFEWNVLQDQQSRDALSLLGKYSDLTFKKVIEDIQYLSYRSKSELISFKCKPNKMVVIHLKSVGNDQLDLNDESSWQEIKQPGMYTFHCAKTIKPYTEDRESDLFKLMESGCYPTDFQLFQTLNIVRKSYEN